MKQKVFFSLCLFPLLLSAWGCDKATPVAPEGTILTISASPSQIGLNGTSTITVIGRQANGSPLNPGTEVRFTTDKGTITPVVAAIQNGTATAILQADTRSGPAKVTASTGTVTADTTIQVGQSAETRPVVIVTASPDNVPVQGTSTITVIARNADGTPVAAGQEVILTSSLGSISPGRPRTAADGTATATLNAGTQSGTATITAIVGSSDPKTTTVTIRDAATDIEVQANPSTVPASGTGTGETDGIVLTAFVANSQGQPLAGAPVTFDSERGSLAEAGVVFTDTSGVARNRLRVTQNQLPAGVNNFQVTASTPSGTGTLLSDTTTVQVLR